MNQRQATTAVLGAAMAGAARTSATRRSLPIGLTPRPAAAVLPQGHGRSAACDIWSDITEESKAYGYKTLIGDPQADAAMFKANSPLELAGRIRQPLLMAYGAWDVRVPLIHGERFRDAVKPHNPTVEWVVYPNEGHGWAHVDTRLDFWGRVEKFLARHIGSP